MAESSLGFNPRAAATAICDIPHDNAKRRIFAPTTTSILTPGGRSGNVFAIRLVVDKAKSIERKRLYALVILSSSPITPPVPDYLLIIPP
jgi:hypothetical protein